MKLFVSHTVFIGHFAHIQLQQQLSVQLASWLVTVFQEVQVVVLTAKFVVG